MSKVEDLHDEAAARLRSRLVQNGALDDSIAEQHTEGGPELFVAVEVADDGTVTVRDTTRSGDDEVVVVLGRGQSHRIVIHPWDW